jgi:hypothetical protein
LLQPHPALETVLDELERIATRDEALQCAIRTSGKPGLPSWCQAK